MHTVVNRLSVGPITHLRISGVIDETFSPQKFAAELQGHVLLDVGRVERISSFGVRQWIGFTGKLPPGASALYLINAPPFVVDQLNMVEGFAGVAQVLSMLAPYTCPQCGEDRVRVVDLVTEHALLAEKKAPEHRCPVCGTQMQFADLPEEFFDYARNQRPPVLDIAVERYLRSLQPTDRAEVVAHVKLVHEDMTYFRVSNVLKGDLNVRRLSAGLEGRVVYDFGNVSAMEPEAAPKLAQIFDTASQSANVTLWRVPPVVLAGLSKLKAPIKAAIATVYLPCDCRNCGNKAFHRIDAANYLDSIASGEVGELPCPICGGTSRVPALKEYASFLMSTPLVGVRVEEMEALEPRALSQYLAGAAAHDPLTGQSGSHAGQTNAGAGGGGATGTGLSGNTGGSELRLQVLKRLGQGGMAEVFLARQVGLKGFEKYVVVKKILENFATQSDFVDMLFAEARANARLTHQNIVQTFDVGLMNGVPYITMEYVRGPDVKKLTTLLKKAGEKMPIEHALRIVAETATGLHYAHSYVDPTGMPHPMVHRDVSPHNILLSLDGAIKLSDFGIAKVQGESEHTRPGTFKGKIAYLSPEAIAGLQVDARSDVFALGVTLFELLTGRPPFRRENEAATLHAIMREPAPRPSKLDATIPEDISDIVMRSLEKDPARRIPSAGAMRDELEQAMTRHRINLSPTAVAQYFQEKLSQQLSEYAPAALAAPQSGPPSGGTGDVPAPGTARKSMPSMATPSPVPELKRATPSPARAPLSDAQAAPTDPRTRAVAPSPQPPPQQLPPRASRAMPAVSVPPPAMPQPQGARTTGIAPALRSPPEETFDPGEIDVALDPPEPQRPAPRPAPRPTAMSSSRVAVVGPPPPVVKPVRPPSPPPTLSQPMTQQPERSAPLAPAPVQPRKSNLPLIAVGAVLALAGVGVVGYLVTTGKGGGIEVRNLPDDETLYVNGVRVDPRNVHTREGGRSRVATALGGKMHRFGSLPPNSAIDVRTLIATTGSSTVDSEVPLNISSVPGGCAVLVDSKPVSGVTPNSTTILAGKEIPVVVTCPGRSPVTRWVMGDEGGDAIELSVTPSSDT